MLLKNYVLLCSMVVLFWGCSKVEDPAPVITPLPNGTLFFNSSDSLMSLSANNGNVAWVKPVYGLFGITYTSALCYEAGLLYVGTTKGQACYNATDGSLVWTIGGWGLSCPTCVPNGEVIDNRTVFKDSLAYFTTPTSIFGNSSELYCVNKVSGAVKWQQRIDFDYSDGFLSRPVIAGDKVLAVGLETGRKIFCFSSSTGQLLWKTPAVIGLTKNIKFSNGKIYASGNSAFCFDVNTGAQDWSRDISLGGIIYGYNNSFYIEGNNFIAVRRRGADNNTDVRVLDKNTGSDVSGFSIPGNAGLCSFKNNILYQVIYNATGELRAYNVLTGSMIWNYVSRHQVPNVNFSAPIVTDNEIVFWEAQNANEYPEYINFLDLNGNFKKEIFTIPYLKTNHFVYIADNKVYNFLRN